MSNGFPGESSGAAPSAPDKTCPTCGLSYPFDLVYCPRDATKLVSGSEESDLVGEVIAERYHLLRKLGEGGMGQVYLAEHLAMSRMCAVKLMHAGLRSDTEAVSRFRREAANAGRISHPNVAAMYDSGETADGLIYLAMEYVPGDSLASLLKWENPLPVRRAVGIAIQVADALAAAHQLGIIHRDLKPDNIIISRSRDGDDLAKVVDFGIAKATRSDAQTVTRVGFVLGTIQYMSPEQMLGEPLDARSDIFSLGVILYEMLVGKRLVEGATDESVITRRLTEPPPMPRRANPNVPKALEEINVRMLARHAEDRFQSAAEVSEALTALRLHPPVPVGRRMVTPWGDSTPTVAVPGAAGAGTSETTVSPGARPAVAATDAATAVHASVEMEAVRPAGGGLGAVPRAVWLGGGIAAVIGAALLVGLLGREPASGVAELTDQSVESVFPFDGEPSPDAPVAVGNPLPTVGSINPARRTAGTDAFDLTVSGRDFLPGSVVRWNGTDRATTYVSGDELRARVPASDLRTALTAEITVANPAPGGGESAPVAFVVGAAASPASAPPSSAPATASPSRPPESEVTSIRNLISSASRSGGDANFAQAFATMRSAEQRIDALRDRFPGADEIRSLAENHSSTVASLRRSCQALADVRRSLGTTLPVCTYP